MTTRYPPANSAPSKKLTIKLHSKPSLPPTYLDTAWSTLESSLRGVWDRKPSFWSSQELYGLVEDLCIHHFGWELYARLYHDVDSELRRILDSNHGKGEAKQTLIALSKDWERYCEQMRAIRLVFTVLDRSLKTMPQGEVGDRKMMPQGDAIPNAKSLWQMGLGLYRLHLERNETLLYGVVSGVLGVIREEREAFAGAQGITPWDSFEFSAHHELLRMLVNLGLYATRFSNAFLTETAEFYQAEAAERFRTFTVPDYLAACERRLDEETQRSTMYLDLTTRKPMQKIVEDCLLKKYDQALLDKGLDELLEDDFRLGDLTRMHRLYHLIGSDALLLKGFSTHTRGKGMTLVMDDENPDLVGALLNFKAKVDRIVSEAFSGDAVFRKAARDAFESFINARDSRPAELLAKYADRALRSTNMTKVEDQLEHTLELFKFLHTKDVFEEFYKLALAKRLLLGTSTSNDLERNMISKLRAECGSAFTNKLEAMFRDIDLSRTLMTEWEARKTSKLANSELTSLSSQPLPSFEASIHVLSMGHWPSYPDMKINLPQIIAQEQEAFGAFYLEKNRASVLHWRHTLAHCLVRAHLPKGRWDLDVSLFQAMVLLQFNGFTSKTLKFAEIEASTLIPKDDLERTLQSLALGIKDQRVLLRVGKGQVPDVNMTKPGSDDEDDEDDGKAKTLTPKPKSVLSDDVFQVNAHWSSKRLRLKINQVQARETKKENDDSYKRVAADRQHQIDAMVVRIMKTRKTLSYNLLITELFKQLKFAPKPQDLKKRIESLIDREYLERSETDTNELLYVA